MKMDLKLKMQKIFTKIENQKKEGFIHEPFEIPTEHSDSSFLANASNSRFKKN